MTVATLNNRVSYAGNGTTTVFSFPNRFLADADLVVYSVVTATGVSTLKTLTTHYTVSGAGGAAGGSVTMLTAPATGTTLVIYRDPALTQPIDLVNGDPLNVETGIETSFDRATLQIQRLRDITDRSMRLNDADTSGADPELPVPVASALLGWDNTGTIIENKLPAAVGLTVVSPFVATLLDDTTAGAFTETFRGGLTAETAVADTDEVILRDTSATTGKRMAVSDLIKSVLDVSRLYTAAKTEQAPTNYAATSGTDTYTAALSPAPTAYATGVEYAIKITNAPTVVAPTLNLNALGAKTIKMPGGGSLATGAIPAGHQAVFRYDGTDMILLNPVSTRGAEPVRNTVVAGAVDSKFQANFLSAGSGLAVNLAATATPVVYTFYASNDESGEVNHRYKIAADVTAQWSSLTANATNYLYVERNTSTGALAYGATLIPPAVGVTYLRSEYAGYRTLLHFDGANTSTTFTDENLLTTWTASGNAQLSTTGPKFGSASGLFDGAGDYITSSFAGGAFGGTYDGVKGMSLDVWAKRTTAGGLRTVCDTAGFGIKIQFTAANTVALYLSSNNSAYDIANGTTGGSVAATASFYHVRLQWDGTTYKVYLDGAEIISVASTAAAFSQATLFVGAANAGTQTWLGNIDELRFESGLPQTLGTFTAPTAAWTVLQKNGENWITPHDFRTYVWDEAGATWGTYKSRVFVGECVAGAASISSAITYALNGRYDQGGREVGPITSKSHNIGFVPVQGFPGPDSKTRLVFTAASLEAFRTVLSRGW